jgi:hypothetical protein
MFLEKARATGNIREMRRRETMVKDGLDGMMVRAGEWSEGRKAPGVTLQRELA